MVGAPQPTTNEDDSSSHLRTRSIPDENRPPSHGDDGIIHARSLMRDHMLRRYFCPYPSMSLPFPVRHAPLKTVMSWSGTDQRDKCECGCRCVPRRSSSRLRATLVLSGARRFGCSLPNVFSLSGLSPDNSPHARSFCGGPAIFLWKLCERFQTAISGNCADVIRLEFQLARA
jgi:hypothetical protein